MMILIDRRRFISDLVSHELLPPSLEELIPYFAPMPATTSAPQTKLGYVPALDGIRGVALLMVLIAHLPSERLQGGESLQIFFVLSGFLITALLVEEWQATGHLKLSAFYWRRALRLLPALFLLLLAFGAGAPRAALVVLLYVANWAEALGWCGLDYLAHLWSLSVEEQFYIVWPLILWLLLSLRLSRRSIFIFLIAAIAASAYERSWLLDMGRRPASVLHRTESRADAILIGCALTFLRDWLPRNRAFRYAIDVAALLALALFSYWVYDVDLIYTPPFFPLSGTVVALAAAPIVLAAMEPTLAARLLSLRPLVWLGRRSYGIYLLHFPFGWYFMDRLGRSGKPNRDDLQGAGLTLVSIALAAASYAWVERPFLKLKARFRQASLPAGPPRRVSISS
jgi:peptidoglycan/LPS O-acetylase OafA/YrhL